MAVAEGVAWVGDQKAAEAEISAWSSWTEAGESMFQKVLIANRGEIAVRIIQACRDLGVIAVAVYSEADREALHAQIADEAVCIGPARAADSYLNMQNIISAALASGCQAIHRALAFCPKSGFCRTDHQAGLASSARPRRPSA